MNSQAALTATDMIASASQILSESGYHRIADISVKELASANVRLFEDPYAFVGVAIYETWNDLVSNWTDAQSRLVELISKYVASGEPKAWDGYLVLLTPSILPSMAIELAAQIRSNTTRLRKLLATGDDLKATGDVERVLLPLLPVTGEVALDDQKGRALELLPDLLARRGIDADIVRLLVKALLDQQPLMETLHSGRSKQ